MQCSSLLLIFLSSSYLISSTMNSFLNFLHALWCFSLSAANSLDALGTHDAITFPPISYACTIVSFLHLSNRLPFQRSSPIHHWLNYFRLLQYYYYHCRRFCEIILFCVIFSPSSSFSLIFFSPKWSHSLHAISFMSLWNRFHENSRHALAIRHLIHLWWVGAMLYSGHVCWISEHSDMIRMQEWFFYLN